MASLAAAVRDRAVQILGSSRRTRRAIKIVTTHGYFHKLHSELNLQYSAHL